jgi:hypothetical protein
MPGRLESSSTDGFQRWRDSGSTKIRLTVYFRHAVATVAIPTQSLKTVPDRAGYRARPCGPVCPGSSHQCFFVVGPNPRVLGFVAKSLTADAYDMLSTMKYLVSGEGMGIGHRPVRYALICRSLIGDLSGSEAEDASNEARVRRQISSKSGSVYNNLMTVLGDSGAQPVLFLSNSDGGAKVCGARAYWLQNCQCGGNRRQLSGAANWRRTCSIKASCRPEASGFLGYCCAHVPGGDLHLRHSL